MDKPKYSIGEQVWFAETSTKEKWITCDDCFGKLALTVILGDGSSVSIDCVGCARGLASPSGFISIYEWGASPKQYTIIGVEKTASGWNYKLDGRYSEAQEDLFGTKEEAEVRAKKLVIDHEKEQQKQLEAQKHSRERTWAWNATYHRKTIKRLAGELEYHRKKLAVAQAKAKATDGAGSIPKEDIAKSCDPRPNMPEMVRFPDMNRDGLD